MGIVFLKYLLVTAGWESIVLLRKNPRPKKSLNPRSHENHIFLNLSGLKYRRDCRSQPQMEKQEISANNKEETSVKTNDFMRVRRSTGKGVSHT